MTHPLSINALSGRQSVAAPVQRPVAQSTRSPGAPSFSDLLGSELQKSDAVRFSAHAQQRLESRNIAFDAETLARIDDAMDALATKGARESLLLVDGNALLVNVPKRTAITVMATDELTNNIFTNIDSAVVISAGSESEHN